MESFFSKIENSQSTTPKSMGDVMKPVEDDDEFFDAVRKGSFNVVIILSYFSLWLKVLKFILGLYISVREMIKDQNVNATDKTGNSALVYAAKYGHEQIAKILIEHNADVNHLNNENQTPLDMSVIEDELEVAELLVESGGNTAYVSQNGRKALDYAVVHSKSFSFHKDTLRHAIIMCFQFLFFSLQ